ncbi:MAG: sigma-70 family RNA polymerase sigma factor [Bacteroidales bacterium]|nr:sigma-70 family RNA polymerase sigma factor [Bacteroidales bacterium]
MDADHELVGRCLKQDKASQTQLYNRFSPKMFGICLRYANNSMEAEDLLQIAFVRVFAKLHMYRFEGSLEGWIRSIIITTAINYYKQQLKFQVEVDLGDAAMHATNIENALSILSAVELLKVINGLPIGYRTVFNLYVIEGYNHQEIGIMLNISESTSKSQLHRAKAFLRKRLNDMGITGTDYGKNG